MRDKGYKAVASCRLGSGNVSLAVINTYGGKVTKGGGVTGGTGGVGGSVTEDKNRVSIMHFTVEIHLRRHT